MAQTIKKVVVLSILVLVYISNQWSRYLLAYLSGITIPECHDLCKDIKTSFCDVCDNLACEQCHTCLENHNANKYLILDANCVNSVQYGLLVGFGFALLYSIATLFVGKIADKLSRKWMIIVGLFGWSTAVFGQVFMSSFAGLLFCRALLGIFEATTSPPCYSLIASYFGTHVRGTANAIFTLAVYLGYALACLSLAMGDNYGWKFVCYVVALYGVIVAILAIFFISEPPRENTTATETQPLLPSGESLSDDDKNDGNNSKDFITAKKRKQPFMESLTTPFVIVMMIIFGIRSMAGYSFAGYLSIMIKRIFPEYSNKFSWINALIVSILGSISTLGGGKLVDYLYTKKKIKTAHTIVPVIGFSLAIPAMIVTVSASNFYVSMIGLAFEIFFAECWIGGFFAFLQNHLPTRIHASATALCVFGGAMIGNLGPTIMGGLDHRMDKDDVRWTLLGMITMAYTVSSTMFFIIGQHAKKRIKKSDLTGELEVIGIDN
eukprot:TRINITY_DN18020_c0_g1_i1.p1 TRINITY_DN18020_c0_g1~~TRINITY_DN18020_c0_g1_i1.p1  ORF type:complete len:492 (-),score=112.95 TRINITY_DN18020_c0_g1_i1:694-2169(-)